MRLTKKLLTNVVTQAIGPEAVEMAHYLKGKTDVSELIVAKDMKITVQEARAMLYKFYETQLASFVRKRDKHKGWHISHWDFLNDNVFELEKKFKEDKVKQLQNRIEREQTNKFYLCQYACSRADFDKAIEMNFKCPECGSLMNPLDNKRTIEVLSGKLKELQEVIG